MVELKTIWGVLLFAAPLALGFSRYYFQRRVCFETIIKFGFSEEYCTVNEEDMKLWFNESLQDSPCKKQCKLFTLLQPTSIYSVTYINFYQRNTQSLKWTFSRPCSFSNKEDMTIDVKCSPTIFKDYFGLLCTRNTDCLRPDTICSRYGVLGVCTCNDGFVPVDGDCKKVISTTTEYQVSTTNPETQQLLQDSDSGQGGSSAGTVAGVGLGGFVFGVVVSLSVVFIMRKRDSPRKQFSESRNTAVNFSYEAQTERIESHQDRDVSNTKQVSHVRPTIRDTPYSNVKRFSENDNGDIYNHLHEKENPGADLDDYDHAHPSNEHGVPDEDYSHLRSQPERGMESQQNDDVYDRATSTDNHDNYFTLERKSDLS